MDKYVEVDGQKYVDDGEGNPKVGEDGNPIPFVAEQTVPYHRFKEVIDKTKALEADIQALKSTKKDSGLTPEQEKELQAKTYLKSLLKETLTEQEEAQARDKEQELKQFEKDVESALELNTDVKKPDFLKFMEEEGDDFSSVASAMKHYKNVQEAREEAVEKAKDDLKGRPNLPRHEGGGTAKEAPETDKGKSITEVAQDIIRGLRK